MEKRLFSIFLTISIAFSMPIDLCAAKPKAYAYSAYNKPANKPASTKQTKEPWRDRLKRYAIYAVVGGAAAGYLFIEVRSRMLENPADIARFTRVEERVLQEKNQLRNMWDMMQALGLQDRENYYPYEQYGNAQYENLLQQILGTFLEQEYANLDTELNQARNERTQARWSNYFYGPAANPEPEARQEQPRRNPFAGFEGFRNFNFNFNEPNFDVPEQDRQDQPNPHDLLGVAQDATRAEIIRAYRDQALLFHPDQFEANRERLQAEGIHTREQAQVRMAEVNHARDILLGNNN